MPNLIILQLTHKMKTTTLSMILLLIIALLLSSTPIQSVDTNSAGYCGPKCGSRCARAGMKDRCMKYCGICCEECKCVPSGTHGNKHECPCYRDKMNSKGNPKCP